MYIDTSCKLALLNESPDLYNLTIELLQRQLKLRIEVI
jgi:hypothetical protein